MKPARNLIQDTVRKCLNYFRAKPRCSTNVSNIQLAAVRAQPV